MDEQRAVSIAEEKYNRNRKRFIGASTGTPYYSQKKGYNIWIVMMANGKEVEVREGNA